MTYESVDGLQKVLAEKVFHYTKDAKKAAGRALGTLVEIITFYVLKSWGFEHSVAIETALPEYGNPEITHNVEYSLHAKLRKQRIKLVGASPISSKRILDEVDERGISVAGFDRSGNVLLTSNAVLRNSCVVASGPRSNLVATLDSLVRAKRK